MGGFWGIFCCILVVYKVYSKVVYKKNEDKISYRVFCIECMVYCIYFYK